MSEPNEHTYDRKDVRGSIGAAIFIAVGLIVFWDSYQIGSWGGSIFPKALAILLVVLSILLIVRNVLGYTQGEAKPLRGSTPRRLGLVVVMLLAAFLMKYLGFIITGVVAYMAIMLFAMYERWTPGRVILYPIVGVMTVFAFHYLFDTLFLVPLPDGRLFW